MIPVLAKGLSESNQRLGLIFLDLFWKFLWVGLTAAMGILSGLWLIGDMGSVRLRGPELDPGNPIMVITMVNQLWNAYSATVLGTAGALLLGAVILWLLLEAVFRGGKKDFGVYFASGAARTMILTAAAAILLTMVLRDRTPGVGLLSVIIMLGTWFLVTTTETIVRKNAVELLAMEFGTLMAVMGFLFIAELLFGVLLWGFAVLTLLMVSGTFEFMVALGLIGVVMVLWTVLHSYLLIVRFSTIDLMRRTVVDG